MAMRKRRRPPNSAVLLRLARAAPGPIYGLDGWEGQRSIAGFGLLHDGLGHIDLAYGDDRPDGQRVRVSTTWNPQATPTLRAEHYRAGLEREHALQNTAAPTGLSPREYQQWVERELTDTKERPISSWGQVELQVDGEPRAGSILGDRDDWTAVLELDDHLICIRSHDVPHEGIALMKVEELTPFLGGMPGTT